MTASQDVSGSTRKTQLFRVGKHLLVHHSRIFQDMFALPQPQAPISAHESYDNVPLVCMPDSAEDLAGLLDLLYNPL